MGVAIVLVAIVLVAIVLVAIMLVAVMPAAVEPAVVASPRLQYAAKTVAACIASGRGEVRQEFRMFVEIWSEYSSLAASAPQKQWGGEPPGHPGLLESSMTATAMFCAHGEREVKPGA